MANNVFINGGVDTNWSTVGNWSLGRVPTAIDGDTVVFDASSPTCNVDVAAECTHVSITGIDAIINGNTLSIYGDFTLGRSVSGTTTLKMAGTGIISSPLQYAIYNDIVFDTLGEIKFEASVLLYSVNSVTHLNGLVDVGTANVFFRTPVIDCAGIMFGNVINDRQSAITTLQSDLNVQYYYSHPSNGVLNGANLNIYGNLIGAAGGNVNMSGTATINLVGNGIINVFFLSIKTILVSGIRTVSIPRISIRSSFTHIGGKLITNNSILELGNATLSNVGRINFKTIEIIAGNTVNADSWFNGSAEKPTTIRSTTTAVYNVKINSTNVVYSRFINMQGANIVNRGSLILTTRNSNMGNNIGLICTNGLTNGFSINNMFNYVTGYGFSNSNTNSFQLF